MNAKISKQGFSLIETLLYLAILSVVGAVMTGILTNVVRISVRETAGNEVTSQLNSVMQNINSLVRQSSNIEIATSTTVTTLKLRMNDKAKDPTCVYISSNIIKLAQGPDATNPQNCTSATSDLTTSKVTADRLNFQKITYYPGHDTVAVNIQLSYNSTNPQAQISRALQTTIGRVSAATFDDNLIPGTNNTFDLGFSGNSWRNAYFSGNAYFPGSGIWNSSGNVGIGTTGPNLRLDAFSSNQGYPIAAGGGAQTKGTARFGTVQNIYLDIGTADASPWGVWLQAHNLANSAAFPILLNPNGGNVGIATTTPAYKLDVLGQINSSGGLCMAGVCKTSWSDIGGPWTTSGNNIYNSNSGYVGIGTVNPGALLDVNGNARISSSINKGPTNLPLFRWIREGATTTYAGTAGPLAIAFDGANMWTANGGSNSVTKITPTGIMTTYAGTGVYPLAIAFDGTNMWTANSGNNSVTKITPTGIMTTYAGTGGYLYAIAFDGTNMWTANYDYDYGDDSVTKITPTGIMTTYAAGTGVSPIGIAFDGTNMWTANYSAASVTKITPAGTMTTYAGTGAGPRGIAFDGTNMWTANYNGNSVTKITPAGAMTTYAGTGIYPYGIAFDGTNMWTANYNNNSVTKITPTGIMTTYAGTGVYPLAIAFDGTNMWTANYGGNSVTKILVNTNTQ